MIVRDSYGLIVQHRRNDSRYADGGDTASRMGIWNLCHPENQTPLTAFVRAWRKLVRHPYQEEWDNPDKTSRDQLVCYVAGADITSCKIARSAYWFNINSDILLPDVQLHLSLRADHWTKYLWFIPGTINLYLSVLWACFVKPDHELNQLICVISSHPWKRWFFRELNSLNPEWSYNLHEYWCEWRDQREICEALMSYVSREIE